jgi:NAD+ synthase (glutamine-hydrolysing)
MRIACGQIDSTIGDFDGNCRKVADFSAKAREAGCALAVFPELCLCGYPPMDLLEYDLFVEENLKALRRLQQSAPPGIGIVVGYVDRNRGRPGRGLVNAASLLCDGKILHTQAKTLLPTYDVFDEARYFEPASERRVVSFGGERIGIAICEDIWWEGEPAPGLRYPIDPVAELLDAGATLILSPSASPFHAGKPGVRLGLLSRIGKTSGVPVVYVNAVGANDSLVFDGQSMVTAADGRLAWLGAGFEEELAFVDTSSPGPAVALPADSARQIEKALVLGIRDYVTKCGFPRVHLGLSGGIDSALVAVLAVEALGRDRVGVFGLPSRYSSEGSLRDARALAANLAVPLQVLPIEDVYASFLRTLAPAFEGRPADVTEENIQARIRGTLLMAWSNKTGSLLLTTGNKSELATGYCTLYGDMSGGLAVIGDLLKVQVYELSRSINSRSLGDPASTPLAPGSRGPLIPEQILTKPPSAELRPDQTDQDSLPPYETLDAILQAYVVENEGAQAIAARGFDPALVRSVLRMVEGAEYKRRQAPPVLKVSPKAFGTGRRIPIARKFY